MEQTLKEMIIEKLNNIKDLRLVVADLNIEAPNLAIYTKTLIANEEANTVELLVSTDKRLQAEAELVKYKELRRAEYPKWDEVIEALMENMEGAPRKLTEIKNWRSIVKGKYPKPIS